MRPATDPYARLLRWYPTAWRDAHGTVFLDTLREQSEHEGRTRPSRGESLAAMVNGLGMRLDPRLGARMTLAGTALTAAIHISGLTLVAAGVLEPAPINPLRDGIILAGFGATAMLVLVGVIALARTYRLLSPERAVAVLALALPALALGTLAVFQWILGFTGSQGDDVMRALNEWWLPVAVVATVPGVVAGAIFVDGLLLRMRLGRLPRYAISVLVGLLVAPFGAYAINFPMGWVAVSVGVAALFMRSLGTTALPRPIAGSGATAARWVRPLAVASAVVGVIGIIYALTASTWSPLRPNGEVAVRQGSIILMVAVLPLLAALGILASDSGRARLHIVAPTTLFAVGTGIMMVAFSQPSNSGVADPTVLAGSVALGSAVGWWSAAPLRASVGERWVAGASIALACVAFQGAYLLAYAACLGPVLAAVIAIRGDLRPRRGAVPANAPSVGV